ncbi:MAG: ZIP family metal transporter [DPANN group archaeon]|nr:ZIP family metal transporter [DPANN group archaeon]
MATTLLLILAAVTLVSAVSFVGVLALYFKKIDEILIYLTSFAAGGLLGAAFLDLLPEAASAPHSNIFFFTLIGILSFFLIELYFHWHHHHHVQNNNKIKHTHAVGYLNLIGDGLHNFIDGAIIAASFLASVPLGIVTTLAVIAHEIPQEFGDFGILLYSGFPKAKALLFNFLTALTAVAGAIVAYFASSTIENLTYVLIPFAAGSFIYIATADIMPEIHKHKSKGILESIGQITALFAGVAIIWLAGKVFA